MGTTPTIIRNITDGGVWQKYPTTNYSNVDRNGLGAPSGQEARIFYFFALPFNKGSQILSATLQIKQAYSQSGSVTVTISRVAAAWPASRVTWNTQPTVVGSGQISQTKSSPAGGTVWTFDLKTMFQTISNGAAWYGIRVSSNAATNTQIWSPQASDPIWRPVLTFTWADNPKTPTMLYPSGGRSVGDPNPTLRCDFTDVSGDTTMQALQVQINHGANNFTAPTFDSGTVLTSVPELPLTQTSYGGLTEGIVAWWRIRVQDGAGLWSGWSVPTSFKLTYLPKVILNNPAYSASGSIISDATPPIDWTVSARTNLVSNPLLAVDATNWTGQNTSISRVVGAAPQGGTFGRATSTSAGGGANSNYAYTNWATTTTVGIVHTASAWVRPQVSGTYLVQLDYGNASATVGLSNGQLVALTAGVWTRISATGVGPGGTTQVRLRITAAAAITVGNYFDFSGSLLETGNQVLPFASGTVASGRSQRAYAVTITNADIPQTRLWTSGKVTATTTVVTPPATVLKTNNEDYQIIVSIWDEIEREAVPEQTVWSSVDRIVDFVYSASTSPATGLSTVVNSTYPWVTLNWSRSSQPDKWNIYRDGVLMAAVSGDSLFVAGTSYSWMDTMARPRTQVTYTVIAVVNSLGATGSPTATVTATQKSTTLMALDGSNPITIFNAKPDYAQVEDATVFTPAGSGAPFVITQGEHGYQGKIQGRLASNGVQTSAQQKAAYNALRRTNGLTLVLAIGDESFQCIIVNTTIRSIIRNEEIVYDIAFDFYQTDFKP